MTLTTRPTTEDDLPALCAILNAIIRTGGTTAHQTVRTVEAFRADYFVDPLFVHTVLDGDRPVGFQALFEEPDNGLAIASFTDQDRPVKGAGAALFAANLQEARRRGFAWIDAKIRADNVPGLAYYSKMGFVDHKVDPAVPLTDGTPVDRITKRLTL